MSRGILPYDAYYLLDTSILVTRAPVEVMEEVIEKVKEVFPYSYTDWDVKVYLQELGYPSKIICTLEDLTKLDF